MIRRVAAIALALAFVSLAGAPPPLICPAGAPIGAVDLRVTSPRPGTDPVPLRGINKLEEGDTLMYRPLLRAGEHRRGEVALVLSPASRNSDQDSIVILEPKPANEPQQWAVPWRVSVVLYVYGPSGLSRKKVKDFLSRDTELIAQLADYAEKTAQTEALITALSSPDSSGASIQAALQGFSPQYSQTAQIDKSAPSTQQALTLFRALNPAIANYDPISPQRNQQLGQTAGLATSVAALFFGSPVGLAAGGTAMLMQLRQIAFPNAEFRSALAQAMPNDALGLCGRREPTGQHTRVAYLWAARIPNAGPPQLRVDKAASLPVGLKSPLPVTITDADWKVIDRARNWTLLPQTGKPVPIKVQKLGETKMLELDLAQGVRPGKYRLGASWDWDALAVHGDIEVRQLPELTAARVGSSSQDLLVSKAGKVPVTLEGADFEFVTKVEIEKVGDKFSSPAPVPFILPVGLRHGPQERMDVQVNTIDQEPGRYRLLLTQLDGKALPVPLKILPAPPRIDNFPMILNEGTVTASFQLKGERLQLLDRLEVAKGDVNLSAPSAGETRRGLTLHIPPDHAAGTSLAIKAYIRDRNEPLTFSDAVKIVGPRPRITEMRVSKPAEQQDVQLDDGELPGGVFLSAILHLRHLQSNSTLKLGCAEPGSVTVGLRLGERAGGVSLQQLAPDQVFLSFDTGAWLTGCHLQAVVANGSEGESEPYAMGRIVRVPKIEKFEIAKSSPGSLADSSITASPGASEVDATLTGQNLETIEKSGWTPDAGASITGLPVPVTGEERKQTLQLRLPQPPGPGAQLYVWLRGESKPRLTKIHS